MHPYENLDEKYFWATAVAKKNMFDISDLWNPKFSISMDDKVVTFGSCFAQHFGTALISRGFNWTNTEPAPVGLSAMNAKKFNYGIFSSRTGNIYTTSLLRQWMNWASGKATVPNEAWINSGRFFDPFRPKIELDGFASREELMLSRQSTIDSFRAAIESANVFVFTLGLTESWFNKTHGHEYPMCPGTTAGVFDSENHVFVNQRYWQISEALIDAIQNARQINPSIRFLLTVSPVPLTATMSGNHVLTATIESKSILRAVAGQVAETFDFVDYFPSYEIINGTPYRGAFFEANQRSVNHVGVEHVMSEFFNSLNTKFPFAPTATVDKKAGKRHISGNKGQTRSVQPKPADIVCEEELLAAFGK